MDKRLLSSLMIVLLLCWGSAPKAAPKENAPERSKSVSPSAEVATPVLEAINSDILAISREVRSAHSQLGAAEATAGSPMVNLSGSIRGMRSLVGSLSKSVREVALKHRDSREARNMSRNVARLGTALDQLESTKGTGNEDAAQAILKGMFATLKDLAGNVAEMPGGEGAIIGDCC